MQSVPNSIIRIPCKSLDGFFKYWLLFLRPIHNMTNKELDVAVEFLKIRYEYSKSISDAAILDKMCMDKDSEERVMKHCGLSTYYYYGIKTKLKNYKFIINNKINPKFIPNIKEEDNNFKLMILFDLNVQ